MQVLLIGCGKMGGALLTQWIKAEGISFTIVDPVVEQAPANVTLVTEAEALDGRQFGLIIVAIKPQLVDAVLPKYKHLLEDGGVLASIAAGCSVQRLKAAMGAAPTIRIMPNLPSEIGKGVSGLFASSEVQDSHRSMVESLMKLAGAVVWVEDEDGLDRITAVAGSGPGYVFEFARAYIEAATELGFCQADARALVLGTLSGTIEMALGSTQSLAMLRDNVTSKNGTTQAGLNALNGDDSLSKLMKVTTRAAYERALEMR